MVKELGIAPETLWHWHSTKDAIGNAIVSISIPFLQHGVGLDLLLDVRTA